MDSPLGRFADDGIVTNLARLSSEATAVQSEPDDLAGSGEQELDMIAIQDMVNQRSMLFDLAHSLANDIGEAERSAAQNIGPSGAPEPKPVVTHDGPSPFDAYGTGEMQPPTTPAGTDFDFGVGVGVGVGVGANTGPVAHDPGPGEGFLPSAHELVSHPALVVETTAEYTPATELTAHQHWPLELVTDDNADSDDDDSDDDPTD